MTETVLFIGGSADGRRVDVKEGMQCFDIPKLMKGGFGVERYSREVLHCGEKEYPVYTSEPPDNLIPLLIEGYGKGK